MCDAILQELDKLDDEFLSPTDNFGRYTLRLIELYDKLEIKTERRIDALERQVKNRNFEVRLFNLERAVEELQKERKR